MADVLSVGILASSVTFDGIIGAASEGFLPNGVTCPSFASSANWAVFSNSGIVLPNLLSTLETCSFPYFEIAPATPGADAIIVNISVAIANGSGAPTSLAAWPASPPAAADPTAVSPAGPAIKAGAADAAPLIVAPTSLPGTVFAPLYPSLSPICSDVSEGP